MRRKDGGSISTRALIAAGIITGSLILLVGQFARESPGGTPTPEESSSQESVMPQPSLDPAFPADFPMPRGARLLNSFRIGEGDLASLGAAWSIEVAPAEVERFYRSVASGRWTLAKADSILGSTTVTFRDATERFRSTTIRLTTEGNGSRISVLLAQPRPAPAEPPSASPSLSAAQPLTLPPLPTASRKPEHLSTALVPAAGRLVHLFEQQDGTLVVAQIEVSSSADASGYYIDAILAVVGVRPELTRNADGTLLTWAVSRETGAVLIRGDRPADVQLVIRR